MHIFLFLPCCCSSSCTSEQSKALKTCAHVEEGSDLTVQLCLQRNIGAWSAQFAAQEQCKHKNSYLIFFLFIFFIKKLINNLCVAHSFLHQILVIMLIWFKSFRCYTDFRKICTSSEKRQRLWRIGCSGFLTVHPETPCVVVSDPSGRVRKASRQV